MYKRQEYVKEGIRQGKEQKQLASELAPVSFTHLDVYKRQLQNYSLGQANTINMSM